MAYVALLIGSNLVLETLDRLDLQMRWNSSLPRSAPWATLSVVNPYIGVERLTRSAGLLPHWPLDYGRAAPSIWDDPDQFGYGNAAGWTLIAIGLHLSVATILLGLTLLTFDRCMGRVSGRGPGARSTDSGT